MRYPRPAKVSSCVPRSSRSQASNHSQIATARCLGAHVTISIYVVKAVASITEWTQRMSRETIEFVVLEEKPVVAGEPLTAGEKSAAKQSQDAVSGNSKPTVEPVGAVALPL